MNDDDDAGNDDVDVTMKMINDYEHDDHDGCDDDHDADGDDDE